MLARLLTSSDLSLREFSKIIHQFCSIYNFEIEKVFNKLDFGCLKYKLIKESSFINVTIYGNYECGFPYALIEAYLYEGKEIFYVRMVDLFPILEKVFFRSLNRAEIPFKVSTENSTLNYLFKPIGKKVTNQYFSKCSLYKRKESEFNKLINLSRDTNLVNILKLSTQLKTLDANLLPQIWFKVILIYDGIPLVLIFPEYQSLVGGEIMITNCCFVGQGFIRTNNNFFSRLKSIDYFVKDYNNYFLGKGV